MKRLTYLQAVAAQVGNDFSNSGWQELLVADELELHVRRDGSDNRYRGFHIRNVDARQLGLLEVLVDRNTAQEGYSRLRCSWICTARSALRRNIYYKEQLKLQRPYVNYTVFQKAFFENNTIH